MKSVLDQFGPQRITERPLVRRIRLHQSWYRAEVLGVNEWGKTAPPNNRELGSVLPDEAASLGFNFIDQHAFAEYQQRRTKGWGVEPYRCEKYMTSSQTLTFNIFAPLKRDLSWLNEVLELLGITDGGHPEWVSFESSLSKQSESFFDKTLADIFIRLRKGGLVVETKLADQFSRRSITERAYSHYLSLNSKFELWCDPGMILRDFANSQLARVHALGAVESNNSCEFLFVYHPLDISAKDHAQRYRQNLTDPSKMKITSLSEFFSIMFQASKNAEQRATVQDLRVRYVDLFLSADAYAEIGVELRANRQALKVV